MKKEKKSIVEIIKNTFKKQSKLEKKKRKTKKKIKKSKPRGYGARRFGAITFWVLFVFMLFFVFVNMFAGSSGDGAGQDDVVQSKVSSHEAVEYSKNFVYDLFNTLEDKDLRKAKLEKYVPSNLKIEDALSLGNNVVVNLKKENITLYDFDETSEEKARFVFGIKLTTKTKLTDDEQKTLEELGEDSKAKEDFIEKLIENDETLVSINKKNEKIRDVELFVVIPLSYNDDSFIVYDYPSYTHLDLEEEKSIESLIAMLDKLNDSDVEANVGAFLDTFFKSFAQDSTDQLQYILNDERYKNGLNNSLSFDRVQDFDLYKGKGEEMIVDSDVVFSHDNADFNVTSNYILVIGEAEQRYVVNHVNDDQYLYDLIYGKVEDDESEDEDITNDEADNGEENQGNEEQPDTDTPEIALEKIMNSTKDKDLDEFKNLLFLEEESPFQESFELTTALLSLAVDSSLEPDQEIDLGALPEESLVDMDIDIDDLDAVEQIVTVSDLILFGAMEQINDMFEKEAELSKYEMDVEDGESMFSYEGETSEGNNIIKFKNVFYFIEKDSSWLLYHYEPTTITHQKDIEIKDKESDDKDTKEKSEKDKKPKKDKDEKDNSKA